MDKKEQLLGRILDALEEARANGFTVLISVVDSDLKSIVYEPFNPEDISLISDE